MSTEIRYGNLEFMNSSNRAFVQSVFGDRNFMTRIFSGAKIVGPIVWGWQFKQFPHANSDFKTVYWARRSTFTNLTNGSTLISNQIYARGGPGQLQNSPNIYNPSLAVFSAGGGSFSQAGFDPATSPTSRPIRLNGSGYTAVQTLEDSAPLENVFSALRSAIANPPDPNYEDLSGDNLWDDVINFASQSPDGATTRIAKQPSSISTQVPYLLSYISATIQGTAGTLIGQWYSFFAVKVGITILNTFINAITSKKYCGDTWRWTQTAQNLDGTFSDRNNCRMRTRTAGPGKVVIVVDMPPEDPDVDTNFSKTSEATASQLYMPPIPEDLNRQRLGYPADGIRNANVSGIRTLPPPGACCDLTP
jgi:hypothetical protein